MTKNTQVSINACHSDIVCIIMGASSAPTETTPLAAAICMTAPPPSRHGRRPREGWDAPADDREMTGEEQKAYVAEYRAKLITPEDDALSKRGASNAGYHYLGCAKTMALIGRAFAEANLQLEKK